MAVVVVSPCGGLLVSLDGCVRVSFDGTVGVTQLDAWTVMHIVSANDSKKLWEPGPKGWSIFVDSGP